MTSKACSTFADEVPGLTGGVAEPARGFVAPPGRFPPPPELNSALGSLNDTATRRENWMLWAVPPPPPPPSSSPSTVGSEPSSDTHPHLAAQPLSGVPPPFDIQLLPGAQSPFDAQSPVDSQPQLNFQPSWNFQASTSWYWRQSPETFPQLQKTHNPHEKKGTSFSLFL
ncbi:nuclear fragile X mental retardation-interacting protein 1-like [Choloepus didactylus]|uniref:nuclear fragile X mental retardation-interacting protein 1-like n=1 Tax=Choloepus didactylus TaxID=27675 RepID=UPI00189D247D|nr:nuclear fragile X mental retardation-interacting protein 1-like [Choloepus didactylus]